MRPVRLFRYEDHVTTRLRARQACLKMIARGFSPYVVAARAGGCAEVALTSQAAMRLYEMVDWISTC